MSLLVALLLTAAVVAYVMRPLLRAGSAPRAPLRTVIPQTVVADGVAYPSEEEWAVDRALGRAGQGEAKPAFRRGRASLVAEIERQVANRRAELRSTRVQGKRPLCPRCGKPFQPADRFCARCGEPHPRICPQCGDRHRPGDRYCTVCGATLPGGQEE